MSLTMKRSILALGASTLLMITLATVRPIAAQEGGIEVFAAETLFDQGLRLSLSHLYKRKGNRYRGTDHVSDPSDELVEEHRAVASIDYGFLPSLTASLLLPVVYLEKRERGPTSTTRTRASGLGDAALITKYRFYKQDWTRGTFGAAAIVGLEMPTGETDARDNGMRLDPSLQPGSGSWDPFGALAVHCDLDLFRFDGLVLYKGNTEGAQRFTDGDFFTAELNAAYRFLHKKYPGPTASVRLGVQFRHEEHAEQRGHSVPNTGSDVIVLRIGLGTHPIPRLDLSVSVDVPVWRNVRGEQLVLDVRTFFGLGVRF